MSITEGEILSHCLQHAYDNRNEESFTASVNEVSEKLDRSIPREKIEALIEEWNKKEAPFKEAAMCGLLLEDLKKLLESE